MPSALKVKYGAKLRVPDFAIRYYVPLSQFPCVGLIVARINRDRDAVCKRIGEHHDWRTQWSLIMAPALRALNEVGS